MNVQRLLDIYAIMERLDRKSVDGFTLCAVAAEFTAMDGASIVLVSDGGALTPLCTSNHAASALLELEISLDEGPTIDAGRGDASEDADLGEATQRWTFFRSEALALGVRAVFAYPVRLGAIRFGVLSLFRSGAGPLDARQSSDAYLMASVIARAILVEQAGGSITGLAEELNGESLLDFRVHQAAGMLAIQGSMPVLDALVFLRARAFGLGGPLADLAERVVTGATRFDTSTDEWIDERVREHDER